MDKKGSNTIVKLQCYRHHEVKVVEEYYIYVNHTVAIL